MNHQFLVTLLVWPNKINFTLVVKFGVSADRNIHTYHFVHVGYTILCRR